MRKFLFLGVFGLLFLTQCRKVPTISNTVKEDSQIDFGLKSDVNLNLVKAQCTACHSSKLISMNRFTREGWFEKIRWMQETQNLWDLGDSEVLVLDYLEKYYSPEPKASRRSNLENIDWYELND